MSWHVQFVVACVICCDPMANNGITARQNFHRIWIAIKKSLVQRAPYQQNGIRNKKSQRKIRWRKLYNITVQIEPVDIITPFDARKSADTVTTRLGPRIWTSRVFETLISPWMIYKININKTLCDEDAALMGRKIIHDDVIKWKHFPRYWAFGWGIHRSPVNSPHKGQWRGALMFPLICALSKQSWGWWFETLSGPLWCHCNVI